MGNAEKETVSPAWGQNRLSSLSVRFIFAPQHGKIQSADIFPVHIEIIAQRPLIGEAAFLDHTLGRLVDRFRADLYLVQVHFLKAECDHGFGCFCRIAAALIRRTDTILDLCKMILIVNQKICDLSDTFAVFPVDHRPAVIILFHV